MIEKAFTTPDVYPMTTNALVSACNQKTNRDPVVSFDAVTVDGALMELRQRNLVRRVHSQGSRSTKHRQTLDETLGLDQGELALVSVLLLRGDQTVGELRLRTERQIGFDSIEAVQAKLDALSGRSNPLVRQLARQPGQKEARWQHLIGDGQGEAVPAPPSGVAPTHSTMRTAPIDDGVIDHGVIDDGVIDDGVIERGVNERGVIDDGVIERSVIDSDVIARVAALEIEIETLRAQLRGLADQLGESLG